MLTGDRPLPLRGIYTQSLKGHRRSSGGYPMDSKRLIPPKDAKRLPQRERTRAFRLGRQWIDPKAREISDGVSRRRVSPRAMAALCLLVAAEGAVVRREDFLDALWPDVTVGEESVTTALSELRRALGDKRGGDRIIETVSRAGYRLTVPVTVEEAPAAPAVSEEAIALEAYTLVQDARRLRARGDRNNVEQAEELSRVACELAPGFALAHAHHAVAACYRQLYRGDGTSLLIAAQAAQTGRRLRPDLAYCHAAEGFALYAVGANAAARDAFGRAFARDPNDFDAHFLASCTLFAMGEQRAAAAVAERAAELRPDDYQALGLAARAAHALQEPCRSVALAARALARVDARLAADPFEPRALSLRALLLALLGREEEARVAVETASAAHSIVQYYLMVALAQTGDVSAALSRLEQLVDGGWRHSDLLTVEPALAGLKAERRFASIASALSR